VLAAFLASMGAAAEVAKYFDWLCQLDSRVPAPLQVCYRTDGQTKLKTRKVKGVAGYRDSQPVQFGNCAYRQRQVGSLGWFADSALIFLEAGGDWKPDLSELLGRAANYVCKVWRKPDCGVWELSVKAEYVASKVMAWVTLDRALRVAERLGQKPPARWGKAREAICAEILEKGWSEERGSFRQRYGAEALDAASLLIPLMRFLPPNDPKVLGTIAAIERELIIDGLVHRFDPSATLAASSCRWENSKARFCPRPFGTRTPWRGLAGGKRRRKSCAAVKRSPVSPVFLPRKPMRAAGVSSATPLLFSQVEYGRALLALHQNESD
ncbi:MAG: glycoside hydrolase family 15 protein, partial [Chthoniobacterales bacterium]